MKEEMRVFWKELKPVLELRFDVETEFVLKEVTKNNGRVLTGVCVDNADSPIRPTVYLEGFEKRYTAGEDLHILADEIHNCLTHSTPEFDLESFINWEQAKLRICMRLVNREKNESLLKDVPHVSFMDLELIFYYLLPQDAEFGKASILIHNSHCAAWGISTEELYSYAKDNTKHLNRPRIVPMSEVLSELGCPDFIQDQSIPMWIMTNESTYFGAVGMYYIDIIKDFAKDRGKSLYVLPSSVHEIILLEDNGNEAPNDLLAMVHEVNSTQVAVDEVLSDSVYRYDLESSRISMLECAA